MKGSTSIRSAIWVIVFFTALSKSVFFLQEIVIAALFGATSVVDAVITSRLVPSFLAGMIGNAVALGLIPLVQGTTSAGPREYLAPLVRRLILGIAAVFGCAVLVTPFFANSIIRVLAPGYDLPTRELSSSLIGPAFLVAMLDCLALLMIGLVQAEKRFLLAGLAGVANGVVSVGALLLQGVSHGAWGIIWASAAGSITQCAILTSAIGWVGGQPGISRGDFLTWRKIFAVSGPAVLAGALASMMSFVDRGIASTLQQGSVAIISWVQKLNNLPIGLLALPLATAIYPFLTESSASSNTSMQHRAYRSALTAVFFLIPWAVLYFVVSDSIVGVLFRRGAFSGVDAERTASVLSFYGLGLVFIGLYPVLSRIAYAAGDSWGSVVGLAGGLVTYVPFGIWLSRIQGLRGLALAYSIAMAMACIVVAGRLAIRGIWPRIGTTSREIAGLLGAAAFAALLLVGLENAIVWAHPPAIAQAVRLPLTATIAFASYVIGCRLFSVKIGMQALVDVRAGVLDALGRNVGGRGQ